MRSWHCHIVVVSAASASIRIGVARRLVFAIVVVTAVVIVGRVGRRTAIASWWAATEDKPPLMASLVLLLLLLLHAIAHKEDAAPAVEVVGVQRCVTTQCVGDGRVASRRRR